jgi:hypothetical protein
LRSAIAEPGLDAVVGAIGSMGSTAQLGKANDETTRAYQAGRQMVEEILAADASQVLALYNAAKGTIRGRGHSTRPELRGSVSMFDPTTATVRWAACSSPRIREPPCCTRATSTPPSACRAI